jgi:hypothetical protein
MKTLAITVGQAGADVRFRLRSGSSNAEVTLSVPNGVEVILGTSQAPTHSRDFPHRGSTKETIVDILEENGGSIKIRTDDWNIYDEVAARLGVSIVARNRLTSGTGEPAWRPEVGFCRKDLEQEGTIEPTAVSGRGNWKLKR